MVTLAAMSAQVDLDDFVAVAGSSVGHGDGDRELRRGGRFRNHGQIGVFKLGVAETVAEGKERAPVEIDVAGFGAVLVIVGQRELTYGFGERDGQTAGGVVVAEEDLRGGPRAPISAGYQASTIDGMCSAAQLIVSGRPFISTTTTGGSGRMGRPGADAFDRRQARCSHGPCPRPRRPEARRARGWRCRRFGRARPPAPGRRTSPPQPTRTLAPPLILRYSTVSAYSRPATSVNGFCSGAPGSQLCQH